MLTILGSVSVLFKLLKIALRDCIVPFIWQRGKDATSPSVMALEVCTRIV